MGIQIPLKPMLMWTMQGPWWSYHASISSMCVSTQHGWYNSRNLNIAILEHAMSTTPMPILLSSYLDMDLNVCRWVIYYCAKAYLTGEVAFRPLRLHLRGQSWKIVAMENLCCPQILCNNFSLLFFDYFLVNILMNVYLARASTLH